MADPGHRPDLESRSTGDAGGRAIEPEGLRALIEAMACDDIIGMAAVGVAREAGGDRYQRWEPGLIADR